MATQEQNWWEQDETIQPAPAPTTPGYPGVIRGAPKVEKPAEPKTTYRTLTPEEVAQRGLNPSRSYQISSEGKIDDLGDSLPKGQPNDPQRQQAVQSLVETIDKLDSLAFDAADNNGWGETGFTGALMSYVPGTAARDLSGAITSVQANTAFDKLQNIKQNSPNGGGLGGNTSDADMNLLKTSVANLDQTQSQPSFFGQVAQAKKSYLTMLSRLDPELASSYAKKKGIRFDENGNPSLFYVDGEDPRAKRDPFGVLPSQTPPDGPNGSGPNGGMPISPDLRDRAMKLEQISSGDQAGWRGLATMGEQGITLGLSDEAAGVGGFLSSLIRGEDPRAGYVSARDARRATINQAREAWPIGGRAMEFLGGGAGARLAAIPSSVLQAGKQGAAVGALSGFGSGEGAKGSVGNALAGTVIGGALGAGFQSAGNAFTRRATANMPDMAVVEAGQRQGIPVRQPDARPDLRGQLAQAESTQSGGPIIRAAREADTNAVEQRIAEVGGQGNPSDPYALGTRVQAAGQRYIAKTKEQANGLYKRAEKLAGGNDVTSLGEPYGVSANGEHLSGFYKFNGPDGVFTWHPQDGIANGAFPKRTGVTEADIRQFLGASAGAKVQPTEAVAALDAQIADLRATGENANSEAIRYLNDVRADLVKPGGITIDAIRNIRTNMRGQISQRGLTGTDTDRRVMAAIDGANLDMARDLPPAAAKAYQAADAFYRQRQEFINGTLKQFLGSRGNPLSAETAAQRLVSMAQGKGNFERFSSMWKQLDQSEQADVSATIAASLGRKANGEFSLSTLVRSLDPSKGINPRTAQLVFGKDGAQALQDLRVIASAKTEAMGRMSPSGIAINSAAGGLKTLLWGALGMAGGGPGGAIAGGAARNIFAAWGEQRAARMLLNPNFTKWLKNAPATSNPQAIDRYFARLATIKGVSANDNQAFTNAITQAFRSSPGTVAAAGQQEDKTGSKPPQ